MDRLKKILIKHEGMVLYPYKDSKGKTTIGVGRNVTDRDEWISETTALQMLEEDIEVCVFDLLNIFPNFKKYSEGQQIALISIRFQCGSRGFRGFKRMIKAIKAGDWEMAFKEGKDSLWYREFTKRASEVLDLFFEGIENV